MVTSGRVRDFVLDLRRGSPWFGRLWEGKVSDRDGALLIPAGCAHGFEALSDEVTMVYLQEGSYNEASDTGVLWSSTGLVPHTTDPTVSIRDSQLPPLQQFDSPFIFQTS